MSTSTITLKGLGMLLRIIAVIFSSIATIFSTVMPLIFLYGLSMFSILSVSFVLLIGSVLIHGILTHAVNDIADYYSGTDEHSPGLLSGGSKVIQTNTMSVYILKKISKTISVFLLIFIVIFLLFGYQKYAILTCIGLFSAISYSLRPFQFAYYPFIGEWFSLFPAMLALGIAAPWISLGSVPIWAWQNALINAVWCMAWVMVHHIPDRHADRQANPVKRTSVVWAEDIFGNKMAKLPAFLYFFLVGLLVSWTALTRPLAALGVALILVYSIFLMIKMDIDDVEDVTKVEKFLLLFAFVIAIYLGIFV